MRSVKISSVCKFKCKCRRNYTFTINTRRRNLFLIMRFKGVVGMFQGFVAPKKLTNTGLGAGFRISFSNCNVSLCANSLFSITCESG